jgi:dihydroorotase
LDPDTGRNGLFDILIADGKIKAVGSFSEEETRGYQVIDAFGLHIMPGFIDLHVHFREPGFEYKETIATGMKAAAKGGFTSVCPMPNTNPAIDTAEQIKRVLDIGKKEGNGVRLYPVGAVTKGQLGTILTDIKGMIKAGAKAISEDGKSVMDTGLYRKAMKIAAQERIPVFAHCEDKYIAGDGVIGEGEKAKELGLSGIPNTAEDVITARDIILAKETGVHLHLCHCSTKGSVEMVQRAKEDGISVTAEVCPHHFSLSQEDIPADDADYKMNPPLRSVEDRKACTKGLSNGTMDVIATDHAPHSEEEKKLSFAEAPFGIVGLETAFALTVTNLVLTGWLTPMQMVERLSRNPARVIGMRGGSLREGMPADLVIADMNEEYRIDKGSFLSKGKNTPFHNRIVKGRIIKTLIDGEEIYQYDGSISGSDKKA